MTEVDILICGAGPAGLGAAWRLAELSAQFNCNWQLLDSANEPGGMAVSVSKDGFTWDLGGHVLFPHYSYFNDVLNSVVSDWVEVKPVRGAWMFDRFIPYPVQRNIRHFPTPLRERCLAGISRPENEKAPENFEQYLKAAFGQGLYDVFFESLNLKMWGTHPRHMGTAWTQHRSGSKASNVPTVDLARIVENIREQRDDPAWSDDTRIRYPAKGGTGSVWRGVAARLPTDRLHLNTEIVSIHLKEQTATLNDGRKVRYQRLFNSMPLGKLLSIISDQPHLAKLAGYFSPAKVDVVGIGVQGKCPEQLEDVCSLYLPDPDIPFWRATVLSNYSPSMAPADHWSILCEVNSGPDVDAVSQPVESVIAGLQQLGFVAPDNIVSVWSRHLPNGYPVPTLQRDEMLSSIQKELTTHNIFSRGRFGGWKYEVCNQDHAFMQGVEVIDAVLSGTPEITYPTPHLAGKIEAK